MISIVEQFNIKCELGEGDVICPDCNVEIGQYDDFVFAWNHIERDRCPICECNGDSDGTYPWCEHCKNWCDARKEQEEQAEYEQYIEHDKYVLV